MEKSYVGFSGRNCLLYAAVGQSYGGSLTMNSNIPSVGMLYLSMNRVNYTKQSISCLDHPTISVLWYDDSNTDDANEFAASWHFKHATLIERKRSGGKGPARAIETGMIELLRTCKCEWLGYYENDLICTPGWIKTLFESISVAEDDGWEVGCASPLSPLARVHLLREQYALAWVVGQVVLFRRDCLIRVLRHWNDYCVFRSMRDTYKKAGLDISNNPYFNWGINLAGLGAPMRFDWCIVPASNTAGYVAVVPVPSQCQDLDRPHSDFGTSAIERGDQTYEVKHIGEPEQVARNLISGWRYPFKRWSLSKRILYSFRGRLRHIGIKILKQI